MTTTTGVVGQYADYAVFVAVVLNFAYVSIVQWCYKYSIILSQISYHDVFSPSNRFDYSIIKVYKVYFGWLVL